MRIPIPHRTPWLVFWGAAVWMAGPAAAYSGPDRLIVVQAEHRCVDGQGIHIGYYPSSTLERLCRESEEVRRVCGENGHVAQLHAYKTWFEDYVEKQGDCIRQGGSFVPEHAGFSEPTDESFCDPAQVIVEEGLFEDARCNYQSRCPTVTFRCHFPWNETSTLPIEMQANREPAQFPRQDVYLPGVPRR